MKNKMLFGIVGLVLVIVGVALCLRDWPMIVFLFKAMLGPLLAIIGLVLMAMIKA